MLLDEIEKAHPDVFNILLQMFDDGSLTDSFGRKVDFRNTVVIMTSNVGTRQLREEKTVGFGANNGELDFETIKKRINDELKKFFNPELLNRINEIIIFHSLEREHIKKIIDILIVDIAKRLAERGISFNLTDKAKDFLVDKGYDPQYGARPLKRALQRFLEDPLAEEILRGQFAGDCDMTIDADGEQLLFLPNTIAPEPEKVS